MKYNIEIEKEDGKMSSFNNGAGFFYDSETKDIEVTALLQAMPVEVLVQVPRALKVLADKLELLALKADSYPSYSKN